MTEQQLREKLQFAYGTMPDATRAAFEHSLTHHRAPETHRSIGLNRTMRIVITAVLMALMLTAVGVAAARFFSVTDVHPAQDGTEGEYQAHYLALEERYDSDLLSVSVNDAVYDGSVLAFTMEMAAKTDDVLAVEVRICGECDGKMYRFDPLDVYGGEFQSLLMLPDLGGTFDGEKYAAEGILLDENEQMPPEGKPIAWTIEIDVLKAVWQTETMPDDLYEALSEEDDVAHYIREQAARHIITLTDAGVEDYLLEMCGAGWDEIEQMSKADLLLRCGGFERAETYTVAFATEGNTQYVHRSCPACGFRWTGTRQLWTMCARRSSAGAWCCTAKRRMERHCRMGRHCRTCGESTATTSRIRRVKRDGRARRAMRACRAAWWM